MVSKAHIPKYGLTPQAKHDVFITTLAQYADHQQHVVEEPHTDDHYTIAILTAGQVALIVDFELLTIATPSLLLVAPEQIHRLVSMDAPAGWLVNIDAAALSPDVHNHTGKPIPLTPQIPDLIRIAETLYTEGAHEKAIRNIIDSIVLLATSAANIHPAGSRTAVLFKQFRALLEAHYKTWKTSADYANAMAVSASHLNDSVKDFSGSSISVHIQERNILEAKRLLYNTTLTAGEIGFQLGYEDPVYFGKLFKKHTTLTPLAFRARFRK